MQAGFAPTVEPADIDETRHAGEAPEALVERLAKTKAEASPSLVQMYGYDFAKMMTKNFERISESDIDAICHACCHYDLRKLTKEEQAKLHLDFGEKDFDWKYSKKTIPVYMPEAELVIRPGFQHCGYMAAHPKEYAEEIEAFIWRNRNVLG